MRHRVFVAITLIFILVLITVGWRYIRRYEEVPPEFREQYNWLSKWLDEEIKEWKPKEYNDMEFGALHMPTNGEMISKTPEEMDVPFLEMLQETGANCIRVTIMLPTYEKYQKRYDALVEQIRARGLKLMISYNTVEKYHNFDEYKRREVEVTETLIKKYRPDYYLLLNEPDTMERRTGLKVSDEQWIELVNEVSAVVKSLNPFTKTVAAVDKSQLYLSRKFASIENLDIVGFNIYNWIGLFKPEGGGMPSLDDEVGEAIDFAEAKGKETFITETWLTSQKLNIKLVKNPSDFNEAWREPLDAKWIKLITYYAQRHKMKGVLPFFTSKFITYPEEADFNTRLSVVLQALKKGERTKVFYAYKEVIEEVKGNVASTKELSSIKVAILYETIIDQARSVEEINKIIEDLNADLIFRGFFRWRGMAKIEYKYLVYEALGDSISRIKEYNPNIIFVGALAAQELNRVEYDPYTKEIIPEDKVWDMALNPQKYGFNLSKEELHKKYWEITGDENYIFPDILNLEYQKLLLDFAKAQIDAGVDAIWIDGFFWQAKIFARLAKASSHPQIDEVFKAIGKIVNEIHSYGLSKGKYIYVGSWAQIHYPYPAPKLDFVTVSPSPEEIREKKLNESKWINKVNQIKQKYGDIPIIAFIDWAFTADTPLGVFSQELTPEEQREVLRNFDEFFSRQGIIFAYPVHGGYMGRDATILSFGKSGKYDSLAPEFQTYEIIKELAKNKYGEENE